MSTEQTIEFVPLLGFEDSYEILNKYPFTIRRKQDNKIVYKWIENNGYCRLHLIINGQQKKFQKHVLIANQFIPNDDPEHKKYVDHRNHIRDDNRLENLRWCSQQNNCFNKSMHMGIHYQFVDEIPDDAIQINEYGNHKFDEGKYYYYFNEDTNEDIFYGKITEDIYKILHINKYKGGIEFVVFKDVNNKPVNIYVNKFKQLYDL